MAKIIIGIHGLANKPEKNVLKRWWSDSIKEGLKHIRKQRTVRFEMVYWADLLYDAPLRQKKLFNFDPRYNDEPYAPADRGALKTYETTFRDEFVAKTLDIGGLTIDALKEHFGMNALADRLLDRLLKDLAFYYDDNRKIRNRARRKELARTVLRDELMRTLLDHDQDEVMLIAHSMGSIIAYDVLCDLAVQAPDYRLTHFVTIGSPLGLPHVKGKIRSERDLKKVTTPESVRGTWTNYADRKDPVAADVFLAGDYGPNSHGIQVTDDLIANDYHKPGDKDARNHHKSYGYLRAPELAKQIAAFL